MEIIEEIKNGEDSIYQYTTHITDIIASNELRLYSLLGQNDPRETQTLWCIPPSYISVSSSLVREERERFIREQKQKIIKGIEELSNYIKSPCRQASFSMSVYDNDNDYECGGDQHVRMWAMYAGNHSGVCLAFSKNKLIENCKKALGGEGDIYAGNVEYLIKNDPLDKEIVSKVSNDNIAYKDMIPKIGDDIIKNDFKKWLFIKHVDWRDEAEYRIVFRAKNEMKSNYVSVPLTGAIQEIIVGCAFDKAKIEYINRYCVENNISWKKIRWYNGVPRYESKYDMEEEMHIKLDGYNSRTRD